MLKDLDEISNDQVKFNSSLNHPTKLNSTYDLLNTLQVLVLPTLLTIYVMLYGQITNSNRESINTKTSRYKGDNP